MAVMHLADVISCDYLGLTRRRLCAIVEADLIYSLFHNLIVSHPVNRTYAHYKRVALGARVVCIRPIKSGFTN